MFTGTQGAQQRPQHTTIQNNPRQNHQETSHRRTFIPNRISRVLNTCLLSASSAFGLLWQSQVLANEIELANTEIAQDILTRGPEVHPNLFVAYNKSFQVPEANITITDTAKLVNAEDVPFDEVEHLRTGAAMIDRFSHANTPSYVHITRGLIPVSSEITMVFKANHGSRRSRFAEFDLPST